MTTTQTAEQIIAALEAEQIDTVRRDVLNHDAAAMLRSQAAEIDRLRNVLEWFMPFIESEEGDERQAPWVEKARAAL